MTKQRKPSSRGTTTCGAGGKEGAREEGMSTKATSPRTRRRTNIPEYCIPVERDAVPYEMQTCLASVPPRA
jgi:hypothetical protein